MADLGDIGVSTPPPAIHRAGAPIFRMQRPPAGMAVDIPALSGSIVQLGIEGVIAGREYSTANNARFWDLQVGNFVASVMWGPGTGSAWSVVVEPSSYTVTRIGGGGDTGFVVWG